MPEDLVSIRNFIDQSFDNPLREFDGTFAGYDKVPAQGYEGWRIDLKYKDVDNIVAAPGQVYNLPTVTINLPLSNAPKSRFGYYGSSLAALIKSDQDIKDCDGQRHHVVWTDGVGGRPAPKPIYSKDAKANWQYAVSLEAKLKISRDEEEIAKLKATIAALGEVYEGGMVPTAVWVVTEVDGSVGEVSSGEASAAEWAKQNLVGKTRIQFNKWAFADGRVRKDKELQRSITDKSFINSLMQLGRIIEDEEGVFQLPEA